MSARSSDHNVEEKKVDSLSEKGHQHTTEGFVEDDINFQGEGRLKRQLKNRHIAMISIGGVIGTGLFLVRLLHSTQTRAFHSPNDR